MDIQSKAKEFVGNWRKFDSFSWSRAWNGELNNPDNYGIYYTVNRDSGLLAQSNASEIDKMFKRYIDKGIILSEHHNHWAVGWIDGYAIPVYRHNNKKLTSAFLLLYKILDDLDNYPILNEDDFSEREYNQVIENCREAVKFHNKASEYSDKRQEKIVDYLVSNCEEINEDYYPEDDEIDNAIEETKRKSNNKGCK